jgi:hypothetical protein
MLAASIVATLLPARAASRGNPAALLRSYGHELTAFHKGHKDHEDHDKCLCGL